MQTLEKPTSTMKKFWTRLAVLAAPFLLIALSFVVLDPFKVLRVYPNYYQDHYVVLSRDYVSTETYLRTREQARCDSFILGSSRSLAYWATSWRQYLESGAKPFHFDASNESLFGIHGKVRLINRLGDKISNALIILDAEVLAETKDNPSNLFVKHPVISGRPWFDFYMLFFRTYLSEFFYIKYWDMRLFHQYRSYMGRVFETREILYVPETNDMYPEAQEKAIQENPEKYYQKLLPLFAKRDFLKDVYSADQIKAEQLSMLEEMRDIFKTQGTKVKIVISPAYNQIPISRKDLAILKGLFGEANVFDYSGVNDITNDMHNYYDGSHYRVGAAEKIMKEIYSQS